MTHYRPKRGLRFWLRGREHVVRKRLDNGELQICDIRTEQISAISEADFYALYFKDELSYEPPSSPESTEAKKIDYLSADFTYIEENLRVVARKRFAYVNRFYQEDAQVRTEESLAPIITLVAEEIGDDKPPNWRTLHRWITSYEKAERDVRALIPKHSSKGVRSRLDPAVRSIIEEAIDEVFLTPTKATIADAISHVNYKITKENMLRQRLGQEPLQMPHRATIYRIAGELDPYEEAVARFGQAAADRMYNSSGRAPVQPTRPLEVVEMDHTYLPFYVIDTETKLPIGVPCLSTAIDKCTGIPVGYALRFAPPSSLSVMECLLHSIRPKDYVSKLFPSVRNKWLAFGLLELLKVDNAKEFYGNLLEDAGLQLGFVIQYAPPKKAWYKACIERFFGMIATSLLRGIPGSFIKFLKEYDDKYDPAAQAIVSFDVLHELIHKFIIDVVSQTSHPRFGLSRAEVWKRAIAEFPPALPKSNQELKILIGEVDHRVVGPHGVEFDGLFYKNPDELTRLRHMYEPRDRRRKNGKNQREKALIKFNPSDMSCIYVFDREQKKFIYFPAVDQEYTKDLSRWQHNCIIRLINERKKGINSEELMLAKKEIEGIVASEWKTHTRGKGRKAMARWLQIDGVFLKEVEEFIKDQESKTDDENLEEEEFSSIVSQNTEILSGIDFSEDDSILETDSSDNALHEYDVEYPEPSSISSLAGISNLTSALASSEETKFKANSSVGETVLLLDESLDTDHINDVPEVAVSEELSETDTQPSSMEEAVQQAKEGKKSNKKGRASSHSDIAESQQPSSREETKSDTPWKPDLTGWSAGYGPKRGKDV